MSDDIKIYRNYVIRHSVRPPLIKEVPSGDLSLIVVIPVYREPDILMVLNSIANCELPVGGLEIITVINAAENSSKEVLEMNRQRFEECRQWAKVNNTTELKLYPLLIDDFPVKHAGVGLARKMGMDEATARFLLTNKRNGTIVCLDADCRVDRNYLIAIESYFNHRPECPAASIYFEHPTDQSLDNSIRMAIINYELFLRYHIEGLRFSGHPHCYHTVGSCMAVRSRAYLQQGGMNKRKAGEDFYFLQKLMLLGNFGEINDTTVYPSARISDRVPFGTGKAVHDWVTRHRTERKAYHSQVYEDLRKFINSIWELYKAKKDNDLLLYMASLPESIREFLLNRHFYFKVREIKNHSASETSFKNRFYRWFNGFLALKYIHYARDHFYPDIPIKTAAKDLLCRIENHPLSREFSLKDLLDIYRKMHKTGHRPANG